MSLRSRKLLLVLGMLSLVAMESACDHKPTEESATNEEYCEQNPTNCTTAQVAQ
jgi:hypothetical protein